MKKGQVTVFIILGLILLITAAIIFYLVQIKEKPIEERAITPPMPMAEADPVSAFVMTCLKATATRGLKIIGDQGGYIIPAFSAHPFEPTEGEGVQFSRGGITTPYWWFMKSANSCKGNCKFESKRPELDNIKLQLTDYVEENIQECVNNFATLKKQGFVVEEKARPKVEINIRENDIFLFLDWKISAKKGETSYDLREFSSLVDLNIKEIYDVATEITNKEVQYTFIENAIKELIFAFARLDKDALPPISDMHFEIGDETYWLKTEVEEKVVNVLESYIPIMQVSGTRNFNYVAAPAGVRDPEMYEILYNRQFLMPLDDPHLSLEVRFYYLDWWKPYFNLNCEGELCKSDSTLTENIFFFFPLQRYNFVYDISVPIMVEISNPSALNGEGYSFRFFLEANLRNNNAFKSDYTIPTGRKTEGASIFCNPNQRTSGDIEMRLKDFTTNNLVEGAVITYTCGDNTCAMGASTSEVFISKFPRCINGVLSIKKQDYMSVFLPLTTDDSGMKFDIDMYPKKELKVTTRKYLFEKNRDWKLNTGNLYATEPEENLIATIMKQPKEFEESYSQVVDLSGGRDANVKLVPGTYKISLTGLTKKDIIIPKDYRCTPPTKLFGLIKIKDPICYWIPPEDIVFNANNPFPSAATDVEFEVTPEELYSAEELLLTYLSLALDKVPESARKIEDLNQITNMKAYSIAREDLVKPVLR